VGVPGLVRGWELALDRFGSMPLHRLLQPARTIAQRGFVVDAEYVRRTEQNLPIFRDFTSTAETFLVDGRAPAEGTVFRNEDLAETYKLLGHQGAAAFYEGPLAEAIAGTVTAPPVAEGAARTVRPGDMEVADLAAYRAVERAPTVTTYRGNTVYGMAPPSSGGTTVGEALNILEGYDLAAMTEEEVLHLLIESEALAFADRNAYVGDPDVVDVPVDGLLSDGFAAERRALIGPAAAPKPVPAGDPWPYDGGTGFAVPAVLGSAEGSTTHLTVADRWGNVVSLTFTIEQIGGSGIAVPGYGFLLNNQLTDFSFDPADPVNAPDGGKRPRSSMSPTIVLDEVGAPRAAFGSPGGATIIGTVLNIAVGVLDRGRSLPEAIAAPRLVNANEPTTSAEPGIPRDQLTALGHRFTTVDPIGNATGVAFLPGGRLQAAAEPARSGGGSAAVVSPAAP
jgi:gamma-glutamyltranspeptidase/glutathione hydrolase